MNTTRWSRAYGTIARHVLEIPVNNCVAIFVLIWFILLVSDIIENAERERSCMSNISQCSDESIQAAINGFDAALLELDLRHREMTASMEVYTNERKRRLSQSDSGSWPWPEEDDYVKDDELDKDPAEVQEPLRMQTFGVYDDNK